MPKKNYSMAKPKRPAYNPAGARALVNYLSAPKRILKVGVKVPMSALPRQLRPETKKFDDATWNAETVDNIGTGWSFNDNLQAISQGDAVDQRNGDKIFIKSISGKFWLDSSPDIQDSRVRVAIIQDNEPAAANAVTPTFGSIFETQATDNLNLCAPLNRANAGRFKILKNWMIPLRGLAYLNTGVTGTGVTPALVYKSFNVKINKMCTMPPGILTSKGVYIYVVAYSERSTSTPKINMVTRTYYTDV